MTFGTRAIASGSAQMPEMVSKILPIRLVLAAGSYVLLALFSFLVPFSAEVRLLTLLFGIALFSGAAILDWAFKGVQRMVVVGIMEILRYVPFLVLVSLWVRGSPDLVVEILSPGTRKTDEVTKRKLYERTDVREYWVVDPELDAIKVYRRAGGVFTRTAELTAEAGDILTTSLLPEFSVSLAEIFAVPS